MRLLATLAAILTPFHSPRAWQTPAWWLPGALCIHHHEGAWNANTGNGYFGGMQFALTTWIAYGGRGRPDLASPLEQLHRAWIAWRHDGGWSSEWPNTARACGLP